VCVDVSVCKWKNAHVDINQREILSNVTLSPVPVLNQFIPNGPLVFRSGNRFLGNQQVIHHTYK